MDFSAWMFKTISMQSPLVLLVQEDPQFQQGPYHPKKNNITFYMPTEITVSKESTIAMRLDVNNLIMVHSQ